MLCEGCYEAAKVRVALSVRTIPGMIDLTSLSLRSSPTGRCTVCNTGPGIWVDSGQRVSLCQTCYERERALKRLEMVIGGEEDSGSQGMMTGSSSLPGPLVLVLEGMARKAPVFRWEGEADGWG